MSYITSIIFSEIIKVIQKELDDNVKLDNESFTESPNIEWGDFALPCFEIAKAQKKDPKSIAKELEDKIKPNKVIKKTKAVGPYINFFINEEYLNSLVIKTILQKKKKEKKQKEKIMIEYSSPNPCKVFHIGHFRNTILGSSLVNIYKEHGYKILSANYLNDTGVHVAKVIWLYLKKYKNKEPKTDRGKWLGDLYVQANAMIDKNEKYKKEVSELHCRVENKEKELIILLEKFKKWNQEEFDRIYSQLNAHFDYYYYDSNYIDRGKEIVEKLLKKGIAKKSKGAIIVDLEKYGLHTLVVLKSDGSAVYITKDFAMAQDRFEKHKVDKLIYVVGSEQILHFKQLFKILELYGFKQAANCQHLPYELVRLLSGKISSRKGGAPLYSDIYDKAFSLSLKETKKRHKEWTQQKINNTADIIALSALKFDIIKYDTNKVVVFDINKALSITGDTGPYILYSLARMNSILSKIQFKEKDINKIKFELLDTNEEKTLIKELAKYEKIYFEALTENKPSLIANYLLNLAHNVNHFYHIHNIIKSSKDIKLARAALIFSCRKVFEKSLELLNIEYLSEM